MKVKRSAARRGVLLLVILGLLAMFGMVAVAFVVLTGHAEQTAKAVQEVEQYHDPPHKTSHHAFMQLVRGCLIPASALSRPHSLLEDMHGQTWVAQSGMADFDNTLAGGQLFEFSHVNAIRFTGCVLTVLKDPDAATAPAWDVTGQSTLIVGVRRDPLSGKSYCQALAFEQGKGTGDETILINGAPFSGTGFGFNPNTGELDLAVAPNMPVALLPNLPRNELDKILPELIGANEDYDAVDFQNMALAGQIPNAYTGTVDTIPSFHRPALVNYWINNQNVDWGNDLDLQRAVILRPMPFDHPNFTGSNPKTFNPAWNGQGNSNQFAWDVDNDGDGRTDGVWLDLGLPIRSTSDGRRYKPLVSFLCVDLDGRLNLNAHGNLTQTVGNWYNPEMPYAYQYVGNQEFSETADTLLQQVGMYPPIFATGTPENYHAYLARGQGYGPAEINLLPLFDQQNNPNCYDQYRRLLVGYAGVADGRYGELGQPEPKPGVSNFNDFLSQNRNYQFPKAGLGPDVLTDYDYWGSFIPGTFSAYGSPVSRFGIGAIGLDPAGCPVYVSMGWPNFSAKFTLVTDDLYEIDLSRNRTYGQNNISDHPFTVAELERLLRPFDRDATRLPPRLFNLTKAYPNDPAPPTDSNPMSALPRVRHSLTTESRHVPCPNAVLPKQLAGNLTDHRAYHVVDLLLAHPQVNQGNLSARLAELFPPELRAGLRMDLNRPFGNGRDDNNDNVVDDISEAMKGEQLAQYYNPTAIGKFAFDHTSDGLTPGYMARQLYARHLYVLLWLLADTEYLKTLPEVGEKNKDVARYLAQWAINVVDFRDRDSIMTPFEYVVNPFNGWTGSDGVVWGCERPELLISETLAFHDRRTEDTKDEMPNGETVDEDGEDEDDEPDKDFDQRLRPQGSLFVELFNPWTPLEPPTLELHGMNQNRWGVELTKVTPPGDAGKGSPVWRLIIVAADSSDNDELLDPDHPVTAEQPDIERVVYFVSKNDVTPSADGDIQYYPQQTVPAVVPCGRYAVIGPSEETLIGFKNGGTATTANTRRIDLTDLSNNDPHVVKDDGSDGVIQSSQVYPPVTLVIDSDGGKRMSVSEPINGYTDTGWDGAAGEYEPPLDEPLDAKGDMAETLGKDQTVFGQWVVFLQRLANPLEPYNKTTNPYRTVDSMAIDLTVFNGTEEKKDKTVGTGETHFHSRQRGETAGDADNLLWKQERIGKTTANPDGALAPPEQHNFNDPMKHSLGYVNYHYYGVPLAEGQYPGYKGSPARPFPWLNWHNRPFISQLELMLVPKFRSSRLLARHPTQPGAYFNIVKPNETPDPYDPGTPPVQAPFPHLMNFFNSETLLAPNTSSQFHRLLEYVHVPSRYAGTTTQVNPGFADDEQHMFRPPFHHISRRRDPGRINLNTVFSQEVFLGLLNCFPDSYNVLWPEFVRSRRGSAGQPDMLGLTSNSPSRIERPFRSFGGAYMVPPVSSLKPNREVNATLLRAYPEATGEKPLFHRDNYATDPNFPKPDDTNRNPYFRYQALQRLGNLVTTRSNVYAVWITVAYFEVEPNPASNPPGQPDVNHLDGYALGQELGIETGDSERHRAFYIFDRSIPVGFQRGRDLNVEKAILLKRFIE